MGDIVVEAPWRQPPPPPDQLFDHVRARLAAADLVLCNLEEPLTDSPDPTQHKDPEAVAAGRDFIFRATSLDVAHALAAAGIRVAALANNHTMDYDARGLLDTLDRLVGVGILPVGAGRNLATAEEVQIAEVRGFRIGFLSFSDVLPPYSWAEDDQPGIAPGKEVARVKRAIARARGKADLLIVVFHWGKQLEQEPTPRQWELARAAQRAGAGLILGAHPHVLEGVGCVGRVPVVFSAGNFVFPTRRAEAQRSAIFEIRIQKGRTPLVRVVPVLIDEQGMPHLADAANASQILDEMNRLSSQLQVHFSGDTATCGSQIPAMRKSQTPVQ